MLFKFYFVKLHALNKIFVKFFIVKSKQICSTFDKNKMLEDLSNSTVMIRYLRSDYLSIYVGNVPDIRISKPSYHISDPATDLSDRNQLTNITHEQSRPITQSNRKRM